MSPAERWPGPLTVDEVAKRLAVSRETVTGWIVSGELKALNVSRSRTSKKPRWRITAEALTAFEVARTSSPAPPPRMRRKKPAGEIIEFYK